MLTYLLSDGVLGLDVVSELGDLGLDLFVPFPFHLGPGEGVSDIILRYVTCLLFWLELFLLHSNLTTNAALE